jgi:hypothetical protein
MHRKILPTAALVAAAASQLGATDCGQITRDPGFDLWCGSDTLCAWKVERGTVERVPTWNEGDPGVALLGDDTAIDQLTPVTSDDTTCIQFTMMANVDLDAHVVLNIDVDADGTIDQAEQLPAAPWKPLSFLIAIRAPYAGVRFEIAKTGGGSAVLAQMNAQVSTACDPNQAALDPRPAPLGAPCTGSGDCSSGYCWVPPPFGLLPDAGVSGAGTCSSCDSSSCGSGDVCGAGTAPTVVSGVALACVPAASKQLGELCVADAECTTGLCVNQACAACDPDAGSGSAGACSGGGECLPTWPSFFDLYTPYLCDPTTPQPAGAPCVENSECSSGTCAGSAYAQCDDGRPCTTALDCPIDGGTLLNGACTPVGIVGGTCD